MTRLPLNEIFKCKTKSQKDKAMYEAHLKYGYALKEIAEYIGMDYATESRVIRKIEREYEK
jgi:DNA-binding MarR family transcriptional regulator